MRGCVAGNRAAPGRAQERGSEEAAVRSDWGPWVGAASTIGSANGLQLRAEEAGVHLAPPLLTCSRRIKSRLPTCGEKRKQDLE